MSDENTLIISGAGASLKKELDVPIAGDYQIALQGLSTYYSWPNITATNNVLKYTVGGTQKSITFPPAAYDMKAMASFITSELRHKGDDKAFRLGANTNTLKAVIDVILANCLCGEYRQLDNKKRFWLDYWKSVQRYTHLSQKGKYNRC